MKIQMTLEQYGALVFQARQGTKDPDEAVALAQFLAAIDKDNGITRFILWVRWQDLAAPVPPGFRDLSTTWPPGMEGSIERTDRPIAKKDVLEYLSQKTRKYGQVLVTRDPAKRVGWTELEVYFP